MSVGHCRTVFCGNGLLFLTRGKKVMLLLNIRDVRKCRNSLELNEFIEKYAAEGNLSNENFNSMYWSLFEEWKRALKTKPARAKGL